MLNDITHWHGKSPPMAPNLEEIEIYQKEIGTRSPVYLLGMTKELMDFCDTAIDLNPVPCTKNVLQMDWRAMKNLHSQVVLGDGVLNLVGLDLLNVVENITERFVSRVFLKKQPWMKYATYFPENFPGCSKIIQTQPEIAIIVWDFKSHFPEFSQFIDEKN